MNSKIPIHMLAYHGWGFSASFWDPLKKYLNSTIDFKAADRGYFHSAKNPQFSDKNDFLKVVLVHSSGIQWCDSSIFRQADHLVIAGGYLKFHPSDFDQYRKSKLVMRQMQSQFVDAPETVLKDYYRNASSPHTDPFSVPKNLNHDLILSDLSSIDRDKMSQQRIYDFDDITIIHGAEDLIVSKKHAREMYHSLRYRSKYFEIIDAGHTFPVTHAEKFSEILISVLDSTLSNTLSR
jgi:pimeloyl-ACP methyl ester carboxylesterase